MVCKSGAKPAYHADVEQTRPRRGGDMSDKSAPTTSPGGEAASADAPRRDTAVPEAGGGAKADAKSANPTPDAKPADAKPATKPDAKPAPKSDAKADAKPAPKPDPKPAPKKPAGDAQKGAAVAPAKPKGAPPAQPARGKGGPPRRGGPPRTIDYHRARFQRRHAVLIASFLLLVIAPTIYATWYLHFRAADQYASRLAFTIQSEDGPTLSTIGEFLGGGDAGGADDADVLYGFMRSQNLVAKLQEELSLRQKFNIHEDTDWYFSLGDDPSIEALVDYWESMVLVAVDTGIIEVEVRAFTPEDAQGIAQAVLDDSTLLINRLSSRAREDAVRDARMSLENAEQRVRDVRREISDLRARSQIVDPSLDLQGQMARLGELETQLTNEQLRLDQLRQFASDDDSRVITAERRISSLQSTIEAERAKLASSQGEGGALSTSIGRFEELTVDRELAERAYAVALGSFETAKLEARRQQRYLSAHIEPTLSQSPQYPERYLLGALVFAFLFLGWVVLVMISYNVKDRR